MHDDDSAPVSARRRMHAAEPRTRRLNVRFNDEELAVLQARAKAFGMATAAYVADTALAGAQDPEQHPLELGHVGERRRLLRALLVLDRELRRARVDGHGLVVEAVAERIEELAVELSKQLHRGED